MTHTAVAFGVAAAVALCAAHAAPAADHPRFDHIFVIVEENRGLDQIIGNPNAPEINTLANEYGLATNFYSAVHPSEGNYIAILGGSTFGIHDDDAFFCTPGSADPACPKSKREGYVDHTIASKSLMDQLADRDLTWKGYFESIPEPGSKIVYSAGTPAQLYGSKHNGFISFASVQKDPDLARKIVGFDQLDKDLASGDLPNYAHVIPNQCDDMHGLSKDAPGVPADCAFDNEQGVIARGDKAVGDLVQRIQASPAWSASGNFAIVVTWDEDDGPHPTRDAGKIQGCCGFDPKSAANFGGGRIATIVVTNHGPRGVKDDTPYNHFSLLRTTEDAFGISEHLNGAGDDAHGVVSMDRLFWK